MLGGAGMLRLKELSEWPTFASKTKQFWISGQTSNIFHLRSDLKKKNLELLVIRILTTIDILIYEEIRIQRLD